MPSDECFTQARKILSKYSDLSQKTKVHLKTKYFLDIDANLKVDNSLLWPRLQKGFEQADKEIAGLMKLGKIETKEAFEKLIKKLCHRGFRERSLKSSLQQRREMFTYVAMAPKIEREKTALLKDEEKNDEGNTRCLQFVFHLKKFIKNCFSSLMILLLWLNYISQRFIIQMSNTIILRVVL